jgi:hypothetical protein
MMSIGTLRTHGSDPWKIHDTAVCYTHKKKDIVVAICCASASSLLNRSRNSEHIVP